MRLSAIKTPTSTATGIVNVKTYGRIRLNRKPTVFGGAELRTSNTKSLPTCCRNRTNVKITVPSRAFEVISRKSVRPRRPILTGCDERRRRNHGQFRLIVLRLFEFQILKEHRGGDDGFSGDVATRADQGERSQ